MENLEPKEDNRLEQLKEAITNSAAGIEAEFSRSANTWLDCFITRIFIIETYLSSPKTQALISPKEVRAAEAKLESLKEKIQNLKLEYPNKENIPPEETRKSLIDDLDILK